MLNGIGGRTIEEAKERLSWNEFQVWAAFREKRGSLFTGRRIEQAAAPIALYTAAQAGVKRPKLLDYMPHEAAIAAEDDMRAELSKMLKDNKNG